MPISSIIEEYETKLGKIEYELAHFEEAGKHLQSCSCVYGTYSQENIDVGRIHLSTLKTSLLKSAWLTLWENKNFNISSVASANDKRKFWVTLEQNNLPEFTMENIRELFGDYVKDPRKNIIRGLAEVFCSLDSFYKSHEKIKIGAAGMPKRIIITNCSRYTYGYGFDKVKDVINALAAFQNKAPVEYTEMNSLWEDEDFLKEERGITLRRFKNGNAHLFFMPNELRDINMALAEYYGDVLADCHEEKPNKKQESKEVSKDLQYYPTPNNVVERLLGETHITKDMLVLEPSCGCGRIMDKIRETGAEVHGIEVDPTRANEARSKGNKVYCGNFLSIEPEPKYDRVVMNPPFYGKHYAKHVEHAMKFLKDGGELVSILPATAKYDHKILKGFWVDLPMGSFSQSGTNINTVIFSKRKESA